MLKGIPQILTPQLLATLAEMGHGDELVLADANFPAQRLARRCVRADGHGMLPLLDAVLSLFPLDAYVKQPAALMQVVAGDIVSPTIWRSYETLIEKHNPSIQNGFEMMERYAFYERSSQAYAIVQSGETELYANIILKKGVIAL